MPKQQWWLEQNGVWYNALPPYVPGMVVKCPVTNRDGTPIAPDDVMGCGSANTGWTGEDYDCHECGIFFASYAADPPHRREKES